MLKKDTFQLIMAQLVRSLTPNCVCLLVPNDIILLIFGFYKYQYFSKFSPNFCFKIGSGIELDENNPNELIVKLNRGTVFRPISLEDHLEPGFRALLRVTYYCSFLM